MRSKKMDEKVGSCIVAGHLCLDIIPEITDQHGFFEAIEPGKLITVGAPTMAPGGAVANTGIALHILGINTRLMGKFGDDDFGKVLLARLAAIDQELVDQMTASPGEETSFTLVFDPPDAERVFMHCPGANNTFGPADIDYSVLYESDLFHFGYPTTMARMYKDDGRELIEMLRCAKETGITTSLDTSMFDQDGPAGMTDWRLLLKRALPHVDIFMPSIAEILLMLAPQRRAGRRDPEVSRKIAHTLLNYGAGIIVLKQGRKGLYMRTANLDDTTRHGRAFDNLGREWRNRELWAPAFKTEVAGTTGAGDCAVGAFLAAVLRGLNPEEALIMASAVGGCNVEAADATSGLRTWAETAARVNSGWAQYEIEMPGWRRDKAARLWIGPQDGQRASENSQ